MTKTLLEFHEDVPADHYDLAIANNIFQKYWHLRRFTEVDKFVTAVEGKVLDIGCHGGLFTSRLRKRIGSGKIYGIDISANAIKKAGERIPGGSFRVADAEYLPFKNNFFNAVFCLEVLEHVDHPEEVLSEIKRVLKSGGYGIILVPTDNLLFRMTWFLWNLKYKVWTHTHVQSFTNSKLENLIKKNGFKIVSLKTFHLGMLKLVKFIKP